MFRYFLLCTALVVYNGRGNLGSTVGLPKFTKFLRDSTYIDRFRCNDRDINRRRLLYQ